jgi:hypothetical protein
MVSGMTARLVSIVLIAGTVLVVWGASGVGLRDAVAFAGFHAAWVLLPGVVLYRLLDPSVRGLHSLGVGWALGYALALLTFAGSAAVGNRDLLLGLPVLALVGAVVAARRHSAQTAARTASVSALGLSVVAALGVVFMALLLVPLTPLPVTTAAYPPDPIWHLAVASEALHHWPVTNPLVSGTPLPYHLLAHFDMAGAAQVTHIDLPVVVLRLAWVPQLLLTVVTVGLLAQRVSRSVAAPPVAAAVYLFVGELDLDSSSLYPFWGGIFFGLTFSPSFLLCAPLFAALLLVTDRLIIERDAPRSLWLGFALLVVAVGAAKAGSLAVLGGGLLLYAGLQYRKRASSKPVVGAFAIVGVVAAIQAMTIYGGAGSGGIELDVLGSVRTMRPLAALAEQFGSYAPLFWLLGIPAGTLAILAAPLIGAYWAERNDSASLFICCFIASLVPFVLLTHPGASQLYLLQLGLLGIAALSASGLVRLWGEVVDLGSVRYVVTVAAAWLVAVAAILYIPTRATAYNDLAYVFWYGAALAYAVVAIRFVTRGDKKRPRVLKHVMVAMLLGAALLNVPLDTLVPIERVAHHGFSLSEGDDVTPARLRGLEWIRTNTGVDDVIAVNRHSTRRGRFDSAVFSVFAERRVFLEGWLYGTEASASDYELVAAGKSNPFSERLKLNQAVFVDADRSALETLVSEFGVRYLVLDKVHGYGGTRASQLGNVVFANEQIVVVRVPVGH